MELTIHTVKKISVEEIESETHSEINHYSTRRVRFTQEDGTEFVVLCFSTDAETKESARDLLKLKVTEERTI